MKKVKKMILIIISLIFLYLISWYNFGYEPEKPFNQIFFRGLIETKNSETKLTYVYDTDIVTLDRKYNVEEIKKSIIPKNIVIKTVNIFGGEKIVAIKENPPVTSNKGKDSIIFKQIPFYTKEIVVTTEMNFKGEDMVVERKFYPYFKFGIWEFWYIPFPFMWEFINGKVLFTWGYL
jgi:hypothetical protein